MNQTKKKIIKANLDKVLKPLGIKYSLRLTNLRTIISKTTKGITP
jgi:hypothetical protein